MDTIEYEFWLIAAHNGDIRLTKREPNSLGRDERAMRCCMRLPESLFLVPTLSASIVVEDAPGRQLDFEAVSEAVGDALKQSVGVDVDLRIVPPSEADDGAS